MDDYNLDVCNERVDIALFKSSIDHIDDDIREAYHQQVLDGPKRICGWKIVSEEKPKFKKKR